MVGRIPSPGPGRYVSVALSVGSPLLGVTQHPRPVELGLSSPPNRLPEGRRRERAATRSADGSSLPPPTEEVKEGAGATGSRRAPCSPACPPAGSPPAARVETSPRRSGPAGRAGVCRGGWDGGC